MFYTFLIKIRLILLAISFCIIVWFVQIASNETSEQWTNWHISKNYDTICPAADNNFSLRYDLYSPDTAKLERKLGYFVSFWNDAMATLHIL